MAWQPAASQRSRKTSSTPQEDLDVEWAKTIAQCQEITKWNLNDKNVPTVDAIVERINPPKDAGARNSKDQAKTVFKNSLTCIERFGQIAAQAASMVFGPSQQCFNAVAFVINAAQKYSAVFDDLTALMERISVFLERLRIYLEDSSAETKLDERLRPRVYEVLKCFVTIMGIAHKLTTSRSGKFRLGLKIVLFGEDEQVKDALTSLETHVSEVTRVEITVIVKDLSEAARNIRGVEKRIDRMAEAQEKATSSLDYLQASENRRVDADQEYKESESLRKALGIEDKKGFWQERQEELWREHIPGTGQWLLDFRMPSFYRWANPNETSVNVICLRADQNFGKSYLCSIVAHHLLETHRKNHRVCVAYYYFGSEQSKARDGVRDSINRALKTIIWQLTQTNRKASREYRKLVARVCNQGFDPSRTMDLWKYLLADQKEHLNATFYILLDGIDDAESEPDNPLANIVNELMAPVQKSASLRVRLFLSGRDSGLSSLQRQVEQKLPEIDLTSPNRPSDQSSLNETDIVLYAEDSLNKMPVFSESRKPEVKDLKEKVKTTLAHGVHGDYFTLRSKLSEVYKARNFDQIEEILTRANEDRAEVIKRQVKHLNDVLEADEIDEVNYLLVWIVAGFNTFAIETLELVLRLESRRTRALVPLEDQIRDRYTELFSIDDSDKTETFVQLKSDDIEDFLYHTEVHVEDHTLPTNKAKLDGEIALLERIVKTHLAYTFGGDGPDMYQKYNFAQFFESKRGPTAARINYQKDSAHVIIARACLIALCDKYDEPEYERLHKYAFTNFAEHLKDHVHIVGLDKTQVSHKQDIGRKLVRLLREPSFIDAWIKYWIEDGLYWACKSRLCDAVYTWLKDPDVQQGLQDMPQEKKWVQTLTAEGVSSAEVLLNIALKIASVWFNAEQDDDIDWLGAFYWLYNFYDKLDGKLEREVEDASIQDIEQIEARVKAVLRNDQEVFQWHYCVGCTLKTLNHHEAAIDRFEQALAIEPNLWKAQIYMATSYGRQESYEKAISTMEQVIESNRTLLDSDHRFSETYWTYMMPRLVSWNFSLKNYAAAELFAQRVLDKSFEQDKIEQHVYKVVYDLMEAKLQLGKPAEICHVLEQLGIKHHDEDRTWLTLLLQEYYWQVGLHNVILDAAGHAEPPSKVFKYYEQASKTVSYEDSDNEGSSLMFRLAYHWALLHWHHGTADDQEKALGTWFNLILEEVPEDDEEFTALTQDRKLCIRTLAVSLITKAEQSDLYSLDTSLHVKCLQSLTEIQRSIGRDPETDCRIQLARLYHLSKDDEQARTIIRDYVAVALQLVADSNGENDDSLERIADVCMALDDDVNAIAAFSLCAPLPPMDDSSSNEQSEEQLPDDGDIDTQETTEIEAQQSKDSPDDGLIEVDHADISLVDPNEIPAKGGTAAGNDENNGDLGIPGSSSTSDLVPADAMQDGASISHSSDSSSEMLGGSLDIFCAGDCERFWSFPDDSHHCKECGAVFCPDCYSKLKAGTMSRRVCHPKHSHLHVPKFNEEEWQSRQRGMMVVDDRLVAIEDWIDGLRKEWGIEKSNLGFKERFVNVVHKVQHALRAAKQLPPTFGESAVR